VVTIDQFLAGFFCAFVVGMVAGVAVEKWLYSGVVDSIYRIYRR
jgi:ABC-type nitrate/sulfonate/bicarbonate transport system permease component